VKEARPLDPATDLASQAIADHSRKEAQATNQ
jgi:arsenic resistance protein ArsH